MNDLRIIMWLLVAIGYVFLTFSIITLIKNHKKNENNKIVHLYNALSFICFIVAHIISIYLIFQN